MNEEALETKISMSLGPELSTTDGGSVTSGNTKKGKQVETLESKVVDASNVKLEEIKEIVDSEFPKNDPPTLEDLIYSVNHLPSNEDLEFEKGMWVEVYGSNMKWELGMIKRVIRQADDDWDFDDPLNDGKEPEWNYFFNVGSQKMVPSKWVRAPEDGLKACFGMRPWLFQQYLLLRLERYLRFDKDHERDFAEVDCVAYANKLFDSWVQDPKNADFKKLYDQYDSGATDKLITHLLSPFLLMDEITEDKEKWNLHYESIGVYSYLSIIGSGWIVTLIIFFVQISVPILLLYASVENSPRFYNDLPFPLNINTDFDTFCIAEGSIAGQIMNAAVLAVYCIRVVPDSLYSFYDTTGDADTPYSRLNSLRKVVWDQGDDTISQVVGYKMELYMNTAYIVVLYAIMLFILFNTEDVIEIILNALAIEFIHQIDEEISLADWFDPHDRYITAGALELVIRSTLRLEYLKSPKKLALHFDIDLDQMKESLGTGMTGMCNSLSNYKLAMRDDHDVKYMLNEDKIWLSCENYAIATNNKMAIRQYKKEQKEFGGLINILNYFNILDTAFFRRYTSMMTWSRWEKVIYLPRVPEEAIGVTLGRKELIEIEEDIQQGGALNFQLPKFLSVVSKRGSGDNKKQQLFDNYDPRSAEKTNEMLAFALHVFQVLTFYSMIKSISGAAKRGAYYSIPFRFFDGLLEILAYLAHLMFPLFCLGLFALIYYCY